MKYNSFEEEVGFIWDVDGVIVDSPHETAWKITAEQLGVKDFDSNFYFTSVASRPRLEGGNNILEKKGVYDRLGLKTAQQRQELLEKYCHQKNELIRQLIRDKKFKIFDSSVRLVLEAKGKGIKQATVSASKNANDMLVQINYEQMVAIYPPGIAFLPTDSTLYSIFDSDNCGLAVKRGKIDLIEMGATKLKEKSNNRIKNFIVFEDAAIGIKSARDCGMLAVGILRIGTEKDLFSAGADLVVKDLTDISLDQIKEKLLTSHRY